jgi:hypothetical protein
MTHESRFIDEARGLIDGGNRTATLFLLAAVIWCAGNVLPLNLSGHAPGTPAQRLDLLTRKANDAFVSCRGAITKYNTIVIEEPTGRLMCPVPKPVSTSDIRQALTLIDSRSNDLAFFEECRNLQTQLGEAMKVCTDRRAQLSSYVTELSTKANLDVLGLKIGNISPTWHPAILCMVLFVGFFWLSIRRRQVFLLLDNQLKMDAGPPDDLPRPRLLSLPWWLYPLPGWTYPNGHAFRQSVISESSYRSARLVFIGIAVLVGLMFLSAIIDQAQISHYVLERPQADLAELDSLIPAGAEALAKKDFTPRSFSLSGTQFLDLLIISLMVGGGVSAYYWAAPVRSINDSRSRRDFLRRASFTAAAVFVASVAAPVVGESARVMKWLRSLFPPPRMPRTRGERKFAMVSMAGWYRNPRANIFHFGKRAAVVSHPRRVRGQLVTSASTIPQGRIRGAYGAIDLQSVESVVEYRFGKNRAAPRLNEQYYSEGIEDAALTAWTGGNKTHAIEIIRTGLTYANVREPLNIRLYDLLALLLLRSGSIKELELLANELEALALQRGAVAPPQSPDKNVPPDIEHVLDRGRSEAEKLWRIVQARLRQWLNPASTWRQKFSTGPRKWNGVDI